MLDLELAGPVRELTESDRAVARPQQLKRLRDSHHAIAKAVARGLKPVEISAMTGYSLARIYTLEHDPTFRELVEFYRADGDRVARNVEGMLLGIALDSYQVLHERILDNPEDIGFMQLHELAKNAIDRAGFAPVSRSINKNINENIGERLDRANGRPVKKDAA